MDRFQYCIVYNQIFKTDTKFPHVHFYGEDSELCIGPHTTCPPPVMDNDYWKWLFDHEPSQDELETLMDF